MPWFNNGRPFMDEKSDFKIVILPSSAQTSTSTSMEAEMAIFSQSPATHPPPRTSTGQQLLHQF